MGQYICGWSRGSAVGVVTRLQAGRSGIRIPVGAGDFSVSQNLQTGSGSHPALYLMGAGVLSGGQNGPFEHSFASRIEVKNEWSYNLTPLICHNSVERDDFIYTCIYIYIYIYIYIDRQTEDRWIDRRIDRHR